jgi:hypothetical protein
VFSILDLRKKRDGLHLRQTATAVIQSLVTTWYPIPMPKAALVGCIQLSMALPDTFDVSDGPGAVLARGGVHNDSSVKARADTHVVSGGCCVIRRRAVRLGY